MRGIPPTVFSSGGGEWDVDTPVPHFSKKKFFKKFGEIKHLAYICVLKSELWQKH